MTDKPTIDNTLIPALRSALDRLDSPETTDMRGDITDLDEDLRRLDSSVEDIIRYWYTDRGPQGLRVRASRAKSDNRELDEIIAAGFSMLKWHTSSGSIDSLMIARFRVGAATYDRLESFTVIMHAITYGRSRAVDAWNRALGRS